MNTSPLDDYKNGDLLVGAVHLNMPLPSRVQEAFARAEPVRDADFAARLKAATPDQHKPGAKLDAGKVRMALVLNGFAPALLEVAKVGTFGANKYSDDGWLSVPNGYARYNDAQLRHGFAHASGELHDEESKLLHLAHEAWNALAKLTLHLNANKAI